MKITQEAFEKHVLEDAVRRVLRNKLTKPAPVQEQPTIKNPIDPETIRWHVRNALDNLKARR